VKNRLDHSGRGYYDYFMTSAIIPAETVNFAPLDLDQFQRGFMLFLYVLSGQVKAPPPPATSLDADMRHALSSKDTTFNRAWSAAGRLFEDESLRLSFYKRLQVFGSLAREPKYDKYLGFCQPSLHLAFVSALARFPFSKGMSPKGCVAAFDEELLRHLGGTAEDRADQAGAARQSPIPRSAIEPARETSPGCAAPTWPSTREAAVSLSTSSTARRE
jgi:hypothetical protein